jgi:hypothetical protein
MTTPPTAFTAELEAMICIMSGDFQEARRWIYQVDRADRPRLAEQCRKLAHLIEQTVTEADPL